MRGQSIPDADLVAEATEFLKIVSDQAETGEKVTLTVTIPKEDLLMLAWLGHKRAMMSEGRITPIGRPISCVGADFARAADYARIAISQHCMDEWVSLDRGDDRLLTQPQRSAVLALCEPMPF